MSNFEKALAVILKHEGGYVNHRLDSGGATKQGVTQRIYDSYRMASAKPVRSVRGIDGSEVAEIYRVQYWRAAHCDEMPGKLALAVFDAAVNHGPKKAIVLLQRVLCVPDDGVFGPRTKQALENILDAMIEETLAAAYIAEREDLYDAIVDNDPSQAVFLRGWKNRMTSLRRELELA